MVWYVLQYVNFQVIYPCVLILYEVIAAWLSLMEPVFESVLLLLLWKTYVQILTLYYTIQPLYIYLLYLQIDNVYL